jgi:elongation factor P
MLATTDFRPKLKIEYEGTPYIIVSCQFVKPGKGVAFYKVKMKNLLTGNVQEKNFRSGDKVTRPDIDDREMQYLYNDADAYHFMDQESYEQIPIPRENLGDAWKFLIEETVCQVMFYKGKAIDIELPNFVVLEVTETTPAVKGDTVQGATKDALLSTGAKIQIPLFLNENEKVKIDTRTGEYVERAK